MLNATAAVDNYEYTYNKIKAVNINFKSPWQIDVLKTITFQTPFQQSTEPKKKIRQDCFIELLLFPLGPIKYYTNKAASYFGLFGFGTCLLGQWSQPSGTVCLILNSLLFIFQSLFFNACFSLDNIRVTDTDQIN